MNESAVNGLIATSEATANSGISALNFNFDANSMTLTTANGQAFAGIGLLVLIIFIGLIWLISIIGRWKTVKKLGGTGWSQVIPIYGDWVLSTSSGCNKTLCIVFTVLSAIVLLGNAAKTDSLASLAGAFALGYFVVGCIVARQVARRFDKGVGFTVGLVLFPVIFYMILGLGRMEPNDERMAE